MKTCILSLTQFWQHTESWGIKQTSCIPLILWYKTYCLCSSLQHSGHNNIPMAGFGKRVYVMKQRNKTVNIISDLKWRLYVRSKVEGIHVPLQIIVLVNTDLV